jgi:hypothetical protein
MISFAIIGTGWRAEFYLRVARACPDRFKVVGLVSRAGNPALEAAFGVRAYPSLDALLAEARPAFVVTSVPWAANPGQVKALVARGLPVLSETPPAPDVPGMAELVRFVRRHKGRVQVAEQVHLRPHHQAQLSVARSGLLGEPREAVVSVSHGYHGISLMRRLLGVDYGKAVITGKRFTSPVIQGGNRRGPAEAETRVPAARDFYWFDFGDKLGVVDFTGAQYFGRIRGEHLQVRGERGELVNDRVSYLEDYKTPLQQTLVRMNDGERGDLHASGLRGYQAGGDWVYRNPFPPGAGLMDDELAIAGMLVRMAAYVRTGREFYPLAEGCQDHYLYLLAQEAVASGRPVTSRVMAWAR